MEQQNNQGHNNVKWGWKTYAFEKPAEGQDVRETYYVELEYGFFKVLIPYMLLGTIVSEIEKGIEENNGALRYVSPETGKVLKDTLERLEQNDTKPDL